MREPHVSIVLGGPKFLQDALAQKAAQFNCTTECMNGDRVSLGVKGSLASVSGRGPLGESKTEMAIDPASATTGFKWAGNGRLIRVISESCEGGLTLMANGPSEKIGFRCSGDPTWRAVLVPMLLDGSK